MTKNLFLFVLMLFCLPLFAVNVELKDALWSSLRMANPEVKDEPFRFQFTVVNAGANPVTAEEVAVVIESADRSSRDVLGFSFQYSIKPGDSRIIKSKRIPVDVKRIDPDSKVTISVTSVTVITPEGQRKTVSSDPEPEGFDAQTAFDTAMITNTLAVRNCNLFCAKKEQMCDGMCTGCAGMAFACSWNDVPPCWSHCHCSGCYK